MKKLIIYYSLIVVSIMTAMGFMGAKTEAHLLSAVLFFPLAVYFWLLVFPKRKKAIIIPETNKGKGVPKGKEKPETTPLKLEKAISPEEGLVEDEYDEGGISLDRREFIKLIGSAGITVFLFSVFSKKAQAAFFGSVPGPGTVSLKDTTGTKIDPAIKTPTDGYKITEIDDSIPAYYGFVEKDGLWFIMKESSSGEYRYTKGSSDFTTNWTNRDDLSYDYFDEIF